MSGNRKKISEALEALSAHESFAAACHVNPEGDALGSALGLAAFLEERGKKVSVYCADPVPRIVEFLPGADRVFSDTGALGRPDAVVVLDSSDLSRTGDDFMKFAQDFRAKGGGPVINIDHHESNDNFGDINLVEPDSSSTCEVLFGLFKSSGREISRAVADCLYTGIVHDTGSFRFPNTSVMTLRAAAELAELGADHTGISRHLYENQPRSKVELLALVIETLRFSGDGRRAEMLITSDMFSKTGTGPQAAEGFINMISGVEGVKVAMLFREQGPNVYKVSFRSHDEVDVAEIAGALGGGGHRQAAGATIEGDLESVRKKVHRTIDACTSKG